MINVARKWPAWPANGQIGAKVARFSSPFIWIGIFPWSVFSEAPPWRSKRGQCGVARAMVGDQLRWVWGMHGLSGEIAGYPKDFSRSHSQSFASPNRPAKVHRRRKP